MAVFYIFKKLTDQLVSLTDESVLLNAGFLSRIIFTPRFFLDDNESFFAKSFLL